MKLLHLLFVCGLLAVAVPGQAAPSESLSRGGLGFLFPDHNSFSNPGQFALDKGTAVEAEYYTQAQGSGLPNQQEFIPSVVYGGTNWGIGAYGERSGTDLLSTSGKTDSVGAGVGVGLLGDRLTIGLSGYRSIDINQTNNGVVGGTITWNGMKRMGFTLGAGVTTTLGQSGGDTQTGTAAVGWGFSEAFKAEFIALFNNLNNFKDWDAGGVLTYDGKVWYFSGQVNYLMLSNDAQLAGRIGLVFGRFDVSVYAKQTFVSNSNPEFGGTVRFAF